MKITLRKKPEPIYIASFDIGIKNLAFCILSYDPNRSDGSRFPIQDWQNLNLIPNNETKYCQQIIQSGNRIGQPCGHQAYNITTNQIPLCKRHTNTLLKNIDDDTSKSLCDASAPDGFSKSLCDTSAPDGFSKSLCDSPEINSTSEEENTSEHNQNVEIIRYRQVANMTTQEINEILVKTLDQFPTLLKCQTIVLEHQPSKNPKMKNLSNMLYSYFVIRGIVDRPEGHLKKILFISPRNKLSIYDGPDITCHLKGSYARNKFYGKKYCEYLIRNDSRWLNYFESHRKKDDLADCFLQGAWYLMSHARKLPTNVNLTAVYDHNVQKYQKCRARAPTIAQVKRGTYGLSNIKYLARRHGLANDSRINEFIQEEPNFGKSVEFHFGNIQRFVECVKKSVA